MLKKCITERPSTLNSILIGCILLYVAATVRITSSALWSLQLHYIILSETGERKIPPVMQRRMMVLGPALIATAIHCSMLLWGDI